MNKPLNFVAAIMSTLLVSACSGPMGVKVETVKVPIEVPVACVQKSDIPAAPPKIGDRLTGDAALDIFPITASALELRKTLNISLALLEACVIQDSAKTQP